MTPRASQDAPKTVPRAPKTGSRDPKIAPRDHTIAPRGLFGRLLEEFGTLVGGSSLNSQPKDCLSMDSLLTVHQFLLLGTSILAIHSNVFEGFAIFAKITSETLSKCRRTSKSIPTWLQNDSRSLPRRSQEDPESCQDQPKSCQDRPKRLQDRPKRSFRAIQSSQKLSKRSPKGHSAVPRALQDF